MRAFGIVKPNDLWNGAFARQLRRHGPEVRELAAYLLTGAEGDPWGIWHIELDTMVLKTGRKEGVVLKSLDVLKTLQWASWDDETQFVYVPDMPAMQNTRYPLLPNDNRVRHAKRWYASLPENPWLPHWWDRHVIDLYLDREPEVVTRREYGRGSGGPAEGPSLDPDPVPEVDLLGKKAPTRSQKLKPAEVAEHFQRIVAAYPKPARVEQARQAFAALKPTPSLVEDILTALEWQVRQAGWVEDGGRFVPSLDRYLKHKRWMDEPPRLPQVGRGTASVLSAASRFIERGDDRCSIPARTVRALPKPSDE